MLDSDFIRYIERLDNHIDNNDKSFDEIKENFIELRKQLEKIHRQIDTTLPVLTSDIVHLQQEIESKMDALQKCNTDMTTALQSNHSNGSKKFYATLLTVAIGGGASSGGILTLIKYITGS